MEATNAVDGLLGSMYHSNSELAWLEVDLVTNECVSQVKIHNHYPDYSQRLSNSHVILRNQVGDILKTMPIWNTSGIKEILLNAAPKVNSQNTTMSPTDLPRIRKVRVQVEGQKKLFLSEVEVFDRNGVNVALGKSPIQLSTYKIGAFEPGRPALAVNGIRNDHTMTNFETGKKTFS